MLQKKQAPSKKEVLVNGKSVSFTDHSDELRCSEFAFCSSPFYDFDYCPLMKQTDNCKNCRWYEDGTKQL